MPNGRLARTSVRIPRLSRAPRRPALRVSLRQEREAGVAVNATTPANSTTINTSTATCAENAATRNAASSGDVMKRISVSTA
jgi:hypothetical protein